MDYLFNFFTATNYSYLVGSAGENNCGTSLSGTCWSDFGICSKVLVITHLLFTKDTDHKASVEEYEVNRV